MEVLRLGPAQSPLRRATFSGSEPFSATVPRSFAVAVARLSKAAPSQTLSNVKELGSAAPLSPPLPEEVVRPSSLQCESGYLLPNRCCGNSGAGDGTLNAMEYLTSILSSKVYDVAYESPLQLASKLSDRLGANVWLKREDFQPVRILRYINCFFSSFILPPSCNKPIKVLFGYNTDFKKCRK